MNPEMKKLALTANEARMLAIQMVKRAASGHLGGSLSCMDILTTLYFRNMRIDPANPQDPDRDRFVMSKGHCSPAMYSVLALRGFFPVEELRYYRSIKGHMSGHVEKSVPGVDASTGSLSQGVSVALGMALGAGASNRSFRVYAILGDGEIEEGQVWECFMAAAKYHLDNFCPIIDVNGLQLDGSTAQIMPTAPLSAKLKAFGFHVIEIDGHDHAQIAAALDEAAATKGVPSVILAKTVKGKGVSFLENQVSSHGKVPNDAEYALAMQELEAKRRELEA